MLLLVDNRKSDGQDGKLDESPVIREEVWSFTILKSESSVVI